MPENEQTLVQQRVAVVLKRMLAMARNDADDAEMLAEGLDTMLTDLHGNDGFGTEGQCDPRGDFRNDRWSITRVEGVDA